MLAANQDRLVIWKGGRHWKVAYDGRFVGILPDSLAKEGLSPQLIRQFRRAGMTVPEGVM